MLKVPIIICLGVRYHVSRAVIEIQQECSKNRRLVSLARRLHRKWEGDELYTKQELLAYGFHFLLRSYSPTLIYRRYFLSYSKICFWTDLVRMLATTGNKSAVAGYTPGGGGGVLLRASNKTPKKSHAEFPGHKSLQKALYDITRKIETLVLNTPKTPS